MYWATILSSLQRLLNLLNHHLIHMIRPLMMKNAWFLKVWLKRHPDKAIAQQAYSQPHGSIWIHCLVVSTKGNALEVRRSLQCGPSHILYHSTRSGSGGHSFLWARHYRLEAVKNNRQDPLWNSGSKAVCLNQLRCIGRWWPSLGHGGDSKWLVVEKRGGEKKFANNSQGPRLFGAVAGQPKPMCSTEGISCSNQANDSYRTHFRY